MSATVGVVIPYLQRERGILRRAVQSVLAQRLPSGVRVLVVVVDDESPLPAQEELSEIAFAPPFELACMSRVNGGPGAARNTGLDYLLAQGADFVAYLDSDDVWYDFHLSRAVAALETGADFYFSNSLHDGVTSFTYFEYMTGKHDVSIGSAPVLETIPGEEAFRQFVAHCIPHTSQVVYRLSGHESIRFDTSLRRTGEDQLFWIELSRQSPKVSYSTEPAGSRGHGVSIYREALSWDSVNAPSRLIDGLVLRRKIRRSFELDREERRLSEAEEQTTRDHFLFLCIRNLRYRPMNTLRALIRVSRDAPGFWLAFPRTLLRVPAHYRNIVPNAIPDRSAQ